MKRTLRRLVIVGGSLLAAVAMGLYAQEAAQPKAAPKRGTTLKTAADMKWAVVPNVKGVQQAVAWGNPQKGPYGAFHKFASGTEVPLHTHTASLRSVIISGTLVITLEGQSPKELGPGSYFFEPGGVKHTTACKAGAECLFYTHATGAFDVVPAEGAAK